MIRIRRALALMFVLIFCCSSSLAAKKKTPEYTAREIDPEVIRDIPDDIQNMLDIAYQQLIPMEEKNKIEDGEVGGLFHVKEAGVGKLYEGFAKLNRITRVPQKGFIAVYGNEGSGGSTPYYHVGLVYDVEKLSDGIYRITTIEGNVKGHTVRMYVRDYDMNKASDKKQKPKDMTLVPEEERDREETNIFSYGYAYTKKKMYLTIFLMPWIPEESQAATEE